MLVLIWVQTVRKGYQCTTLGGWVNIMQQHDQILFDLLHYFFLYEAFVYSKIMAWNMSNSLKKWLTISYSFLNWLVHILWMAQNLALSIWMYSFVIGSFSMFFFFTFPDFFQNQLFQKILSRILSESQIVWPNVLSGLIWVQTVCKSYQQTTLGDKEFIDW